MSQFFIGTTAGGLPPSVATQYTPDSGGVVVPVANNLNVFGQTANGAQVMETDGSTGTITIENRAWVTEYVVDPSATQGLRGTYQTITAALAAAVAPANIFIRPGTYTENFTLQNNVFLIGMGNGGSSFASNVNTTINGQMTLSSGNVTVQNLGFQTNSTFIANISGGAILNFENCNINITNNAAFTLSTGGRLNLYNCNSHDGGGTNANLFNSPTNGSITINSCTFLASTTTTNTIGGSSSISINNSTVEGTFTTSGTSAQFGAYNSTLGLSSSGQIILNANSTASGSTVVNEIYNCLIESSASVISIGAGASFKVSNSVISSTVTDAITGTGTISYGNLSFNNTSSLINTTTQIPLVRSNDAVRVTTPGAYPYTTVPQDGVILVNTTSARTITPLASPTTGQIHRIKDATGSAGTNNITITPSGNNIDGAASFVINVNYGSIDIVYNGTQWNIL